MSRSWRTPKNSRRVDASVTDHLPIRSDSTSSDQHSSWQAAAMALPFFRQPLARADNFPMSGVSRVRILSESL